MKITGVICEYNPFHSGHALQLKKARELSGKESALVCVMGGNFVQRGEPALVSKHVRAEMAAGGGADLVLELPLPWAVASARRFAEGGVALLKGIGADFISFGAECPDARRLWGLAHMLADGSCDELIRAELATGISYAAARERAAEKLAPADAMLLREPNNILAVEYLAAMARRGSGMTPLPVERAFAGHDGGPQGDWAGASHIRAAAASGGEYARFMPPQAAALLRRELEAGRTPDQERLDAMIMLTLRTMTPEAYSRLPDAGEGLGARLARFAAVENTVKAVLDGVKTKRYAYARLRRMVLAALLGITAEAQAGEPPYIRVLALGERGREALREIKARTRLPLVTKPAAVRLLPERAREIFALEARAGDIYALTFKNPEERRGGTEWTTSPAVL